MDVIKVVCSYTKEDESLLKRLEMHLSNLREQSYIEWHGCEIRPGLDWQSEAVSQLATAHIILLLISPGFLASECCRSIDMRFAIRRHEAGEARVIPILLRPCDWERSVIAKLEPLPKNRQAITNSSKRDQAFFEVVQGIRRIVDELRWQLSGIAPEDHQYASAWNTMIAGNQENSHLLQDFRQEIQRQRRRALVAQTSLKIDKDMLVRYDLDVQMREFSKRLNFGGAYAFVVGGQSNILRDYIIERMCRELRNKLDRSHRKIDISLLGDDLVVDRCRVITRKILERNQYSTLQDPFKEDTKTDVVLTIWNHSFPPEILREAAHAFWEDVTMHITPVLQKTGQCFVVILANVGEKADIQRLDHFILLSGPDGFDMDHLTQWISGWLKKQGVQDAYIENSLIRVRANHGHFLSTYQEIESIVSDLQGRNNH